MSDEKNFVIENGILLKYTGRERNLVIPDTVERINCDFHNNHALRKVTIPDSVVYGGWSTFQDCTYLREVKLSERMDDISRCMFQNTALESIVVPKSVKEIGDKAFADCKALRKVVFLSEKIKVSKSAFRHSPNIVIYCHKSLCQRFGGGGSRPCYPLEDLDKESVGRNIAYYEDEEYMKGFPAGKPIEKVSSFKVQVEEKELKVRFKPESCLEREFKVNEDFWYTFAEILENYVSKEESLEEYYKEDPNCRTDGFMYAEPRLRDEASPMSVLDVKKRVRFLKAVYRGLNNQETAQKLAEYVPKKKNGFFNASVNTRIACAGVANSVLKIPEIVAKAKDETTLEVFVKCMGYSPEEVEKLNDGVFASLFDKKGAEPS